MAGIPDPHTQTKSSEVPGDSYNCGHGASRIRRTVKGNNSEQSHRMNNELRSPRAKLHLKPAWETGHGGAHCHPALRGYGPEDLEFKVVSSYVENWRPIWATCDPQ